MSQNTARQVLRIESQAIASLIDRVDESFDRAVDLVFRCKGRIVATGMGKSGIVCRKIAATLASTGTPALFMHPAEAIHGDLGMLAQGDLVLALSNSGETAEIVQLLKTIKRLGIPLLSMVGNLDSSLARDSEIAFDVGVDREACGIGLVPTASTTAALAWGDALAVAVSERKGLRIEDFARLHPGGGLGKRMTRVEDLMHAGDRCPLVSCGAPMEEVIYTMSSKGLGVAAVVDLHGRLSGVISDGDLRRLLQRDGGSLLSKTAEQCMTRSPVTISPGDLAEAALHLMEERKITSLMVVQDTGLLAGVVHLHDLWGTQFF